jgi:hypothetical protein
MNFIHMGNPNLWTSFIVYWWITTSNECKNGWISFSLKTLIHGACLTMCWWIKNFSGCENSWISFMLKTLIHSSNVSSCVFMNYQLQWMLEMDKFQSN